VLSASNYSAPGYGRQWAIVRYLPDGGLDSAFGANGIVTTSIAADDQARALAIQADGKIVVVGVSSSGHGLPADFTIVRYTDAGTLDSTFGSHGIVTTTISPGSIAMAYAVAIQPDDGKIVAAGYDYRGGSNSDLAVARYDPTGNLDTAFGNNGIVTTTISGPSAAYGIALQPDDGKIVVVGLCSGNGAWAVVRYTSLGALDSSFGLNGQVCVNLTGSSLINAKDVVIQPDNKIVVYGFAGNPGPSSAFQSILARYTITGMTDLSFGNNGIVTTSLGLSGDASGLALQSDGKFVAVGSAGSSGQSHFHITRYTSVGDLDATFGEGGVITMSVSNNASSSASGVVIQPDGKIVVAGSTSRGGGVYDFAIVRYFEAATVYLPFVTKQ
jgi:uncharacterized delta-60 repeat protein